MQKTSFVKIQEEEMSEISSEAGSAVGVGLEEGTGDQGNKRKTSGDKSSLADGDTNGRKSYGSTKGSPWRDIETLSTSDETRAFNLSQFTTYGYSVQTSREKE